MAINLVESKRRKKKEEREIDGLSQNENAKNEVTIAKIINRNGSRVLKIKVERLLEHCTKRLFRELAGKKLIIMGGMLGMNKIGRILE